MAEPSRRRKVLCPVGRGEDVRWMEVGTAFTHEDGTVTIYLDALPSNGQLKVDRPRGDETE